MLLNSYIYHTFLALEWFNVETSLDVVEDIVGAMVAIWWGFLFYGLFNEVVDNERLRAEDALRESEKNPFRDSGKYP